MTCNQQALCRTSGNKKKLYVDTGFNSIPCIT